MRAQDLEPELEELLLRLVPDLAHQWQGASEDEIAKVEVIAGRPLPRFYRWFLLRMGRSMGPIAYPRLDFTARKVLECYAEGLFGASPRFLMIGYESDIAMPLHVLYDFDHPARDDARVTKRHAMGGDVHDQFDSFREMIAWGKVLTYDLQARPQQCVGMLSDSGGDVLSHLGSVMKSLGFESPVPTGPRCGIYLRADASMVTSASVGEEPKFHAFRLGGADAPQLRRILGEIATETSLELEIDEWNPRLPA